MNIKKKLVTGLVTLIGFGIGAGSVAFAGSMLLTQPNLYADADCILVAEFEAPEFEVNENGNTFGSTIDVYRIEDMPDLTWVLGDNGLLGYAYTSELEVSQKPSSPEEAVRMMEERARNGYIRVVNVYESDGVTLIDTFTIGSSDRFTELGRERINALAQTNPELTETPSDWAQIKVALDILRHIVGLPTEIEVTVETHDFDGNGIIEIADALLVLREVVGLGGFSVELR